MWLAGMSCVARGQRPLKENVIGVRCTARIILASSTREGGISRLRKRHLGKKCLARYELLLRGASVLVAILG